MVNRRFLGIQSVLDPGAVVDLFPILDQHIMVVQLDLRFQDRDQLPIGGSTQDISLANWTGLDRINTISIESMATVEDNGLGQSLPANGTRIGILHF